MVDLIDVVGAIGAIAGVGRGVFSDMIALSDRKPVGLRRVGRSALLVDICFLSYGGGEGLR